MMDSQDMERQTDFLDITLPKEPDREPKIFNKGQRIYLVDADVKGACRIVEETRSWENKRLGQMRYTPWSKPGRHPAHVFETFRPLVVVRQNPVTGEYDNKPQVLKLRGDMPIRFIRDFRRKIK